MQSYKSTRYRCDHCGKTSGSASAMKRHEAGCTMNPDRTCRFCMAGKVRQKPMVDLLALIAGKKDEAVSLLREATEGCPACIHAALKQSKMWCGWTEDEDGGFYDMPAFDFRSEVEQFWREINSEMNEEEDRRLHNLTPYYGD